jgi:membrane dipeptidase
MKKLMMIAAIAILFAACKNETPEEKALRIHDDVLTIDSHTDTPLRFLNADFDIGIDNSEKKSKGKIDFPRMEKGGMDASFFAVFLGQRDRTEDGNDRAIKEAHKIFDALFKQIGRYPEMAEIATEPEDAYRLEKEGKRAIYIGIENGYAIGDSLELVKKYYDMGARYITLCHTKNNDLCDSSTDTVEHDGLSAFGKDVVKEMNALGMMIDVSHISDKAFYDVIELSTKPVIASHSCARAICDNPRNMDDDMLKALQKNKGVIQMCILSDYVKKMEQDPARAEAQKALRKKYNNFQNMSDSVRALAIRDWYAIDEEYPAKKATVSDVVDHIDHMVKVVGIDHIGIGTDFDGGGGVDGCNYVDEMANITIELVKRGYSEEDIRKIWGGNFMRVFKAQA